MSTSITDRELDISDIYFISRTLFKTRNISCLANGRYSDCFFYVLDGGAFYRFGETVHTVGRGDIFYLAKGSLYTIEVISEPYNVIFVDFDFIGNEKHYSELFSGEGLDVVMNLFSRMNNLWKLQSPLHKTACKGMLYEIYYQLLLSRIDVYVPRVKRAKIDTTIEYIGRNYTDFNLSTSRLAAVADMSEVYYRRIFKQIYHIPPVKYMMLMRINKAKELLTCSEMPINQISEQCGFSSAYYFSRVFKKETGMPPTDYRRLIN